MAWNESSLRVIQITDTHICALPGARLWNVDVDQSLSAVLKRLRLWHWPADFILNTGDLVQDEGEPAYQRVIDFLEPLGIPVYCLPGNHDLPMILNGVLVGGRVRRQRHVINGAWQFILLDSTRPHSAAGHLSHSELFFLQRTLDAHPDHYAVVCLHHQPVPVGSSWLDGMMIDNAKALFNTVDRHPQVRAILWGHTHQEFAARRNGVDLLGAPSTCVQFKPYSEKALADTLLPGYRWLELYEGGTLKTGVERIVL